jgi:hypothetical protein
VMTDRSSFSNSGIPDARGTALFVLRSTAQAWLCSTAYRTYGTLRSSTDILWYVNECELELQLRSVHCHPKHGSYIDMTGASITTS